MYDFPPHQSSQLFILTVYTLDPGWGGCCCKDEETSERPADPHSEAGHLPLLATCPPGLLLATCWLINNNNHMAPAICRMLCQGSRHSLTFRLQKNKGVFVLRTCMWLCTIHCVHLLCTIYVDWSNWIEILYLH